MCLSMYVCVCEGVRGSRKCVRDEKMTGKVGLMSVSSNTHHVLHRGSRGSV